MPSYLSIYVVLLLLKAFRFPVLRDISWGWFIFWPVILVIVKLLIRILEFIISPIIVFGFLWLLAKLYFLTT